jgi:opacity protein-like surface antigen
MKNSKLFLVLIALLLASMQPEAKAAANEGDGAFAEESLNYSQALSFSELSFLAANSELFPSRKDPRRSKPKQTEASRRSRSRSHNIDRAQSYRPAASSSVRPGKLGFFRPSPQPSNVSHTRGHSRASLRPTDRQRYFGVGGRELGFNIGTAHSFNDIQASKGLGFTESVNHIVNYPGLSLGVYYRFRMVEWFGLNLGFDYGRLSGENFNSLSGFEGYSFTNDIFEFNSRIAFYAPLSSRNEFDIYGFAGLALFHNNPKLSDSEGNPVNVSLEYSKIQPAIPFGVGFSWRVNHQLVIGYELGYRYTAFNLLDGAEPLDTRYDAYMFNNLRVGFILKPRRR